MILKCGFPSVFSGGLPGLFGPGVVLVRLRLGLADVPVLAGFSLGREVKKAPRTSSSCAVAAIPIATPQRQTNAKTMTLNRITESPSSSLVNCAEYGCRKQSDYLFDRAALLLSRTAP